MHKCRLSIATTVDGTQNGFVSNGEMKLFSTGIRLQYVQENANVVVEMKRKEVSILREGDYTLSLLLKEKETTKGSIGICGSNGEISVYTHEIDFEKKGQFIKLGLTYDLYFGEEAQKMQLSLIAKREI